MSDINRITPHILTATDFSTQSKRAFYHALSLAVAQQARLTLLHIGPESRKEVPWEQYPGIRDTLVKWKLLAPDAARSDVSGKLGLSVKKMAMRDEDAYNGMVDYLRKHPTDLLVMSTEGRRGVARLKRASVAETVAYATHSRALLLPENAPDLVDEADGIHALGRALFIYDHEPDPRSALTWLGEWLPVFNSGQIDIHLLYIGDEEEAPDIALPQHPQLNWERVTRQGSPLPTILEYAEEIDADAIAMMNQRGRGLIGRLKGSLCGQVLRRAQRPVLLLPEI